MIIHSKMSFKCLLGGHLHYLLKHGKNRTKFTLPGFIKSRNDLISLNWQELNFRFAKDEKYKHQHNVNHVPCFFDAPDYHIRHPKHIKQWKYAAQIIDMSKTYDVSITDIQDAIVNHMRHIDYQNMYNNVNVCIIDTFIMFNVDISNVDREQHVFEEILLPDFLWKFNIGLQIFPLSYNCTHSRKINNHIKYKKITQKYFFIVVGGFVEIFGINVSIDIEYFLEKLVNLFRSKEDMERTEEQQLHHSKKTMKADQIIEKKLVGLLGWINWTTVSDVIEFVLFTFRIIDFTIKIHDVYYNVFFDFAMGKAGLGCHREIGGKQLSLLH
jgi:hypothetical protein